MRLFIQSLSEDSSLIPIPEISAFTEPLDLGVDTAQLSAWWWWPYLASDFPEITGVTKKYFWLYSTDHTLPGSYWGEGDNLDLSDFVEKGKIFTTSNSPETPRLCRVPNAGNGDVLFLYYHPSSSPQETRLYTTSGGSLTQIGGGQGQEPINPDWTFRGTILGLHTLANGNQIGGFDENHTGYLTIREIDGGYEAKHVVAGLSGSNPAVSRYSTSVDGINWTRLQPDVQQYFEIDGELWTTGLKMESVYNNGFKNVLFNNVINEPRTKRKLAMSIVDEDWQNPVFIKYLDDADDWSYTTYYLDIETSILHLYAPKNASTNLYHATLDMTDFNRWDI